MTSAFCPSLTQRLTPTPPVETGNLILRLILTVHALFKKFRAVLDQLNSISEPRTLLVADPKEILASSIFSRSWVFLVDFSP